MDSSKKFVDLDGFNEEGREDIEGFIRTRVAPKANQLIIKIIDESEKNLNFDTKEIEEKVDRLIEELIKIGYSDDSKTHNEFINTLKYVFWQIDTKKFLKTEIKSGSQDIEEIIISVVKGVLDIESKPYDPTSPGLYALKSSPSAMNVRPDKKSIHALGELLQKNFALFNIGNGLVVNDILTQFSQGGEIDSEVFDEIEILIRRLSGTNSIEKIKQYHDDAKEHIQKLMGHRDASIGKITRTLGHLALISTAIGGVAQALGISYTDFIPITGIALSGITRHSANSAIAGYEAYKAKMGIVEDEQFFYAQLHKILTGHELTRTEERNYDQKQKAA